MKRNAASDSALACCCAALRTTVLTSKVRASQASAHLYSLVQTARANELEPYAYLRRLFTELPAAQTVEQIEVLLPWNIKLQP